MVECCKSSTYSKSPRTLYELSGCGRHKNIRFEWTVSGRQCTRTHLPLHRPYLCWWGAMQPARRGVKGDLLVWLHPRVDRRQSPLRRHESDCLCFRLGTRLLAPQPVPSGSHSCSTWNRINVKYSESQWLLYVPPN
jgi:hypothetical protein